MSGSQGGAWAGDAGNALHPKPGRGELVGVGELEVGAWCLGPEPTGHHHPAALRHLGQPSDLRHQLLIPRPAIQCALHACITEG